MSTSTSGPGGVKNLRAMFENKTTDQSNSPPSRGRSPNGSVSSVQSRPLSKVRASFVAVERPGDIAQSTQWGLRKASDIESMDGLKEEAVSDSRNGGVRRGTTSSEGPGLGLILKGSPFESLTSAKPSQTADAPTKNPSNNQTKKNSLPKPTSKVENVASMVQKLQNGNKSEGSKKEEAAPAGIPKLSKPQSKIAVKQSSPTATKSSPKIPARTPTTPTSVTSTGPAIKPKGGVNKIKGVMESSEKAKQERQATASKEIKPPSVASKSTAATKELTKKEEISQEPEQGKPAATRPTKLPSAALQTTAAAAAKREQGNVSEIPKVKVADRKPTVPQAPKVATASTRASLARKSSRTSLAPVSEKPKARLSTASQAADESFLSRMTRPTTSSAQKAHDKVQASGHPQPKRTSLGGRELPKKTSRKVSNINARAIGEETNGGAQDNASENAEEDGHTFTNGAETATPQQQAEVEL